MSGPRPGRFGRLPQHLSPAMLAAFAGALVVLVSALLRQEGIPKIDTLWAEDGATFLHCAYGPNSIACLWTPYEGYLHLAPRLIAAAASALPPFAIAAGMVLLASCIAALFAACAAWSVARGSGSALAGVLAAMGIGLVWQAGREVLGNAANLHWVLLVASLVVLAGVWLGAPIRPWTIAMVVLAGLSSAFSPLIAMAAGVALILKRPFATRLLVASLCVAAAQVAVEITSQRDIATAAALSLDQLVTFGRTEVVQDGFFGPAPLRYGIVIPTLLALSIVGLILSAKQRSAIGGATVAIVVAATGVAICVASLVLNRAVNPRYAYVPAAMIVAALAVSAGLLSQQLGSRTGITQRVGRLLMPGLIVVLGLGFATSFRLESRASAGPSVPTEVQAMQGTCAPGGTASILISPSPASTVWVVRIPCSRFES